MCLKWSYHIVISLDCICFFLRGRKLNFNFFCSFKKTWFPLSDCEKKKVGKKHCLAIFHSRFLGDFIQPLFQISMSWKAKWQIPMKMTLVWCQKYFLTCKEQVTLQSLKPPQIYKKQVKATDSTVHFCPTWVHFQKFATFPILGTTIFIIYILTYPLTQLWWASQLCSQGM